LASPRRKGNQAQTAEVRIDILKAAFSVFAHGGFNGSSLKQVAAAAGISDAGLLHHFNSKVALLNAVLEYRDSVSNEVALRAHSRGLVFPDDWYDVIANTSKSPDVIRFFAVMSAEATNVDHPAHEYFASRYLRVTEIIAAGIQSMKERGLIRANVDSLQAAKALIALSDGMQVQWLLNQNVDLLQGQKDFMALLA
jgi:AcrR family transcriptional regulator